MYFRELGGMSDVAVYDGAKLEAGQSVQGPAVIEEALTTIVLNPNSQATATPQGNIWIDVF